MGLELLLRIQSPIPLLSKEKPRRLLPVTYRGHSSETLELWMLSLGFSINRLPKEGGWDGSSLSQSLCLGLQGKMMQLSHLAGSLNEKTPKSRPSCHLHQCKAVKSQLCSERGVLMGHWGYLNTTSSLCKGAE